MWGEYLTRLKFCDKIINVNERNYGYLYEVNMEEGKIMEKIEPFKQKVWLASPTMHGEELEYVTEAYIPTGCLQSVRI